MATDEWPTEPELVEQQVFVRAFAAARRSTSSSTAPGRTAPHWCSPPPAAAKRCSGGPAHPQTSPPKRHHPDRPRRRHRIAGHRDRPREQYAYRFVTQQATTTKRALPRGEYGVTIAGRLIPAVERKSLADRVSSLINGKFALRP